MIDSKLYEVELPILMQMVEEHSKSLSHKSWFVEVRLNAKEWDKLIEIYKKGKGLV